MADFSNNDIYTQPTEFQAMISCVVKNLQQKINFFLKINSSNEQKMKKVMKNNLTLFEQ